MSLAGNSTNSPLSPIDAEMAILMSSLDIALDRVSILRNKMESVLSPAMGKCPSECGKAIPDVPICPLVGVIKARIYQANELGNILNDLIDRVET